MKPHGDRFYLLTMSFQDTVVALQALTLYRIKTPQGRLKMDVSLVSVQSGKKTTFKELRDGNRNVLQIHKEKVTGIDKLFIVPL